VRASRLRGPFARLIADGGQAQEAADEALRAELRATAERSDSQLMHDDLAQPTTRSISATSSRMRPGTGLHISRKRSSTP
jgi:hypothetical protein